MRAPPSQSDGEGRSPPAQKATTWLTVAMAENGRVALEMLQKGGFDLVLLDMEMPEMSGFQVLEQMVTTGQRVDLAMPLYRIGKLNPLWLEIHAPLEGLPFVKPGMLVTVPKLQASGKLIAVIRNVNKSDQTLHLRAEISKGAEKLSPGQFVEAVISLGGDVQYYSVPKSALSRQGADTLVFVQTKTGFTPLKVKVISEQGSDAVVDAQFKGDEKIAVTGISAIKGAWLGLGGE